VAGHAATQIYQRPDGQHVLVLQKSRLVVQRGPDRGSSFVIDRPHVVVGTDADCDLRLADAAVSRRQFEVRLTPGGHVLRDLESTNGTVVEGMRVVEAYLRRGARIEVGRTTLRFTPLHESVELLLSPRESFGDALGRSPAMRHVFAMLERVAPTDTTILLEGETGTGKEVLARAIHGQSPRAGGPFVVVDCGSIPAGLVESELFGHEKGAFTGAAEARAGAFEVAAGGTLLLDEVGELPPDMQPKLLRALESREVRRLGANRVVPVDLRVVAATHRDLSEDVRSGRFREDLFYRLAVVRVRLPALRERREDIALLAKEIAHKVRPDADPAAWLGDGVIAMLVGHDWPGNVRELRNVIDRLAAFPEAADLALDAAGGTRAPALANLAYHEAKARALDAFERAYLHALLAREAGVVSRAAERAGVPRQTFHRLIKKHGLRAEGD
jgi:two-component system, NtrC family, response regulator GlrR